jgi:hypothetical protein
MIAWLGRGEVEAARRNLREAAAGWTVPGLQQFWFLAGETLIDLYEDNGEVAWERLQRNSSDIRRTLFVVYPVSRFTAHLVCGSAAVAAAGSVKSSRSRSECLREAEHHARKLRAGPSPQVRAVAPLIEAGIAGQRGKFGEAAQHLESGARALDAVNMRPHADAARRHLARLRGEPLPEFLAGEQVFDPDAVAHMLVPGFRV